MRDRERELLRLNGLDVPFCVSGIEGGVVVYKYTW
jgi:hypothetical protein